MLRHSWKLLHPTYDILPLDGRCMLRPRRQESLGINDAASPSTIFILIIIVIAATERPNRSLFLRDSLRPSMSARVLPYTSTTMGPNQDHHDTSPPTSPTRLKGTQSPMSIDLSSVPPLIPPSPPSNTLIITVRHPSAPSPAPSVLRNY